MSKISSVSIGAGFWPGVNFIKFLYSTNIYFAHDGIFSNNKHKIICGLTILVPITWQKWYAKAHSFKMINTMTNSTQDHKSCNVSLATVQQTIGQDLICGLFGSSQQWQPLHRSLLITGHTAGRALSCELPTECKTSALNPYPSMYNGRNYKWVYW